MAEPERKRAGRVSSETFINALERRYAVIKGRYETAEQECESAIGVAALIEAQDRVVSDKILMRRVLDAIEVVARDIEPDWKPSHIRPIYPVSRDSSTGQIALTAYNILRRGSGPMTIRELARASVAAHGHEVVETQVARFDRAIRAALNKKVGRHVGIIQGPPARYYVMEPASRGGSRQDHHRSAAASSPSIPTISAQARPPA
ncbi:MAG: hypothetical protein Q7T23_06945 [Phenylobacterium sp.]|nr:hypothetical protein [Phenylobacterium sp.]